MGSKKHKSSFSKQPLIGQSRVFDVFEHGAPLSLCAKWVFQAFLQYEHGALMYFYVFLSFLYSVYVTKTARAYTNKRNNTSGPPKPEITRMKGHQNPQATKTCLNRSKGHQNPV